MSCVRKEETGLCEFLVPKKSVLKKISFNLLCWNVGTGLPLSAFAIKTVPLAIIFFYPLFSFLMRKMSPFSMLFPHFSG